MNGQTLNSVVKMILPESARTAVRSYRKRLRRGLPPILDPAIIDHVVEQMSLPRPRSVRYQSLTTWKNTGTFRLVLRFENGQDRRLIYKRAVYSLDEIPANQDLPVRQGPPERLVADTSEGPITAFVPRAYWVQESATGDHFDYIWEDLSLDHQHFVRYQESHSRAEVAGSLAAMHAALRQQFPDGERAEFLRFDRVYCEKIWDYTMSSLPRYFERTGDHVVRSFLDREDEVRTAFLDSSFHLDRPSQAIHGDCNGTNIWVKELDGSLRMKAVDWEWAGYGLPHADMISILKWSPEEEKEEFLERYCSAADLDDIAVQRRWLRRANMERAVLDAGFLSKQYLDPARSQEWFSGFITGSIEQLLTETERFLSGRTGL